MSGETMTRRCRARTAAVLCVVCVLTPGAAYGQSDGREYSLSSGTTIVGGRYVGTPPLTWHMYREDLTEVEVSISLSNQGRDALYFNTGMIERAMRIRLFSMDEASGELQERAVRVTTRGIVDQDGISPLITLPDQLLLAEGRGKGVVWIMAATQPDGRPFPPGRYRFEIEVDDIRSAIVTFTGERLPSLALTSWSGVTKGHVDLVITAPSTPAEVATMYVQRAEVARDRRQFDEAVTLFRRAVDANPSDAGRTLQLLGGTYLRMGRYRDAVPVLERLPIRGAGIIESSLALAYVGAGREAEAMELLRRGGRSEAQVVGEIERLRETVRQGPVR